MSEFTHLTIKPRPLTERVVQNALFWMMRSSHHSICPNFTPHRWYENDIFAITKSGYWHEFEIKLTKADFKADANKRPPSWRTGIGQTPATKHELIAAKHPTGPNRFYYVLPAGVVDDADVPEWAGIMRVTNGPTRAWITRTRQAPWLHKNQVRDELIQQVKGVFYYRLWSERTRETITP
jgi:hypothetical protein